MFMNRGCLWRSCLCLLFAGIIGCGSQRPATVQVKGTVTFKSEPVEGAAILFTRENGPPATGETDAEGVFTLTTFEPRDGAVPAEYSVAITKMESASPLEGDSRIPVKSDKPPRSLLPRKYSDPRTSDLKETVTPGAPNEFAFELQE